MTSQPNSDLSPEELDRLIELASAYREDRMDDADVAELDTILAESPAAREAFVEIGMLVAELSNSPNVPLSKNDSSASTEHVSRQRENATTNSWIRLVGLITLAASLLLALGLWAWSSRNQDTSFAQLESVSNCLWEVSATPTRNGQRIGTGHFRLAEGIAKVRFDVGALVDLEGPAYLEVLGQDRCRLHSGKLVVTVENDYKGFTVDTPRGQLIDQGTSFGVTVEDTGASVVEVFGGIVDVKHHTSGEQRRLSEEAAVRLLPKKIIDDSKYAPPMTGQVADVIQVSTATPGSAECAIRRDGRKRIRNRNAPLSARTSKPTNSKFDWRSCFRFVLTGLPIADVESATLQFNAIPSGMGYASKSVDTTFAAYGILDDTLDDWSPDKLLWKDLPGVVDDPASAKDVRLLGRFTVPSGQQSGQFAVTGPELSELIKQDSNQLISIVLVSETEVRKGMAWHAFAEADHPTLKSTTLSLRLKR